MRWLRLGLILAVVAVLPALPGWASACADIYPAMALGPFPAEAEATVLLFYAAEDSPSASFHVRWTGLACGQPAEVSAEYGDQPGSAVEGADYNIPPGQRTPSVCETGCASGMQASVSFALVDDPTEEAVTERFTIALSNPAGGSLDPPSSAPFVLVDDDGLTDRVALDDLAYEETETRPRLAVPIWRAGPATGTVQVPYTAGDGSSTATANSDYRVTSPNPLVFGPGDRVELVILDIENDSISEADETVELTLGAPNGAQTSTPSSKTLVIRDNEESSPPHSRLHHPRQGRTYRADDYRLREVHVFTEDTGGSGVTRAQLAIRSNLGGGRCGWYSSRGFRSGSCDNPRWIPLGLYEPDFFFARLDQLRPTAGTRIRSYTAYSRAFDGAGNAEPGFAKGRNLNTFEVKPARPGSS